MEIKTITETERTFDVVLDDKGIEKKVFVITKREGAEWKVCRVGGAGIKQSVEDFLVDAINGYVKTGKILKAPIEVAYTTLEHRHWTCPHCGHNNTTAKLEQGYPSPKCHFCEEQSDWGNKGGE